MSVTDTAKWRAVYNDNSMLDEVDKDGNEHAFKEIQFDKLELFQLINQQNIPICQVRLGDGKRLIFTRRNIITTGSRLVQQGNAKVPLPVKSHQKVIIIGWQKTINGANSKSIFYLLPDGRIEMDDQWREDSLHSAVNTPGLTPEKNSSISDNKVKGYVDSNDSAFKNK